MNFNLPQPYTAIPCTRQPASTLYGSTLHPSTCLNPIRLYLAPLNLPQPYTALSCTPQPASTLYGYTLHPLQAMQEAMLLAPWPDKFLQCSKFVAVVAESGELLFRRPR